MMMVVMAVIAIAMLMPIVMAMVMMTTMMTFLQFAAVDAVSVDRRPACRLPAGEMACILLNAN